MRVLLATDRPGLGAALSLYLGEYGVDVVGVVARASEILEAVAGTEPDAVVLDERLAGDIGGLVGTFRQGAPDVPVVVLGSAETYPVAVAESDAAACEAEAAVCAADALASVGDPPAALLAALDRVAHGAR